MLHKLTLKGREGLCMSPHIFLTLLVAGGGVVFIHQSGFS